MAMIASVNQLIPSEAPTGGNIPFEQISASPAAFGAGVGQAINQAGNEASQQAQAWQQLHNENVAKDSDIQVTAKLSDIMYNPQNGFATKMGKDAVDGYADVRDQIIKVRQEALDNMPNPQARSMLDQVLYRRMGYAIDGASSHAAQENKKWMIQTSESRAKTTMDDAALNYNDNERFNQAVATAHDEALAQGEQQGWGPEQVKLQQAKYTDYAWANRIERMALHDPVGANDMFQSNIDKMPISGLTVEKQLNAMIRPREAISISDDVFKAQPIDPTNPYANLKAQISLSDTLADQKHPGDVEFRDQARTRVMGELRLQEEEAKRSNDAVTTGLYKTIIGDGTHMISTMKDLLADPVSAKMYAAAKPETQMAVYHLVESIQGKGPDYTPQAISTYSALKGLALNPETRKEFSDTDLTPYYNTLPRTMMMDLVNLKAQAGSKAQQDEDKSQQITHSLEVAKPLLLAAGFPVNAKAGTSQAQTYNEFVGRYSQELNNFYAQNKKVPNDQDLQGITTRLLQQGYQSGTGWIHNSYWNGDNKVKQFQSPPDKFYIPAPKDKAPIIRQQFKERTGREPTDNEVNAVWTASQQTGKK
jgi:lipopolysaccharide export LptBFGC system permease protein LptF